MKKILVKFSAVTFLLFAGCVTSPFLSEDAATRLAAVDALVEQRKLVEVALDYCTEPYQELPTGCQMDVRVRAVEKLTDRDMLMAVATFSIVRTSIRGRCCYVTLGEPNKELRELALTKLTEGRYIASVLEAKNPFDVKSLFSKALFGYYEIDGRSPVSAESAWFKTVKEKESVIVDVFCNFIKLKSRVAICQNVFSLLPTTLSQESKNLIGATFKDLVGSVKSVSDATYVLQITSFMPSEMVLSAEIDAMSKRISSHISTVEEFVSFVSLINGEAKKHISDTEELIKVAAVKLVPKLNSLGKLSVFADVIKNYEGAWVREITGNAVIAVLDSIVEGKSKETIKDFVEAVSNFDGEILSDKAILRIFTDTKIISEYESAMRSDGYKDQISNEVVGSAIRGGSLGDILAAGFVAGAMGDKKSPVYNKMFSHLAESIRNSETFINVVASSKLYLLQKMVIDSAGKKIDSQSYAKCLIKAFENLPDPVWWSNKILKVGAFFVDKDDEKALEILQPAFHAYARSRNNMIVLRAIGCFNEGEEIESRLCNIKFDVLKESECRLAYLSAIERMLNLCKKRGLENKYDLFFNRISNHLVKGLDSRSGSFKSPKFLFSKDVAIIMDTIAKNYPELWARIMLKAKIPPFSHEFSKVLSVLGNNPKLLVKFLCSYESEPYVMHTGKLLSDYNKECDYLPVFYYDSEWYWKSLCAASKMSLSPEERTSLNQKMIFFAVNGLELEARREVYNSLVDDACRRKVKTSWDNAMSKISANTTELFNFSLNQNMSKMKWEKLWNEKYKNKRILLRGKVMDVEGSKLILNGGADVIDNKFIDRLPSSSSLDIALETASRDLKRAEENVKSARDTYNMTKQSPFNLPFKDEEERLKKAEEKLAELKKKENAPLKVILKYTVEIPEKYRDGVSELQKGEEVIFEAYPYRVYPRSTVDDIENRTRTFSAWMREGRIYKGKE